MAEEQFIQLLFSNFGASPFGCKRLAQGLKKPLSAINSLVRGHHNPVVKADRSAQYR